MRGVARGGMRRGVEDIACGRIHIAEGVIKAEQCLSVVAYAVVEPRLRLVAIDDGEIEHLGGGGEPLVVSKLAFGSVWRGGEREAWGKIASVVNGDSLDMGILSEEGGELQSAVEMPQAIRLATLAKYINTPESTHSTPFTYDSLVA